MTHPRRFRWAVPDDFDALGMVAFEAVHAEPSPYSHAQRAAWMPAPRTGPAWHDRLSAQSIVVAEGDGGILGFMSLADGGYIDFAYILPVERGTGLFRHLYAHILARAEARGIERLWVHASLAAEPAFRALGFDVIKRERIALGDEHLERCEMALTLPGGAVADRPR